MLCAHSTWTSLPSTRALGPAPSPACAASSAALEALPAPRSALLKYFHVLGYADELKHMLGNQPALLCQGHDPCPGACLDEVRARACHQEAA